MKILWVTNIEINAIAKEFGETAVLGGWLEQTANMLAVNSDVSLHIACSTTHDYFARSAAGITFYSFNSEDPDPSLSSRISKIVEAAEPDVVHIWGTEYRHSLLFARECDKRGIKGRVVVSIQGLVSVYTNHFFANLPARVIHHRTFKELVRPNLYRSCEIMRKQGESEVEVLKLADNCIGRTDWDLACVKQINDSINYYAVNEILREPFYTSGPWSYEKCTKRSIFFSQANYPIKGFHFMLQALAILKKKYPDVMLHVLGNDPFDSSFTRRLKRNSYEKYLQELMTGLDLKSNVKWLGRLDAEGMVNEYLNSNVFVCSSTIENSSNSIGEAMLLGVPVAASDVGGIKTLMRHGEEGILFHDEAYYMLADCVSRIFDDPALASRLGANARIKAMKTHDVQNNMKQLLKVYESISGK